MRAGPKKGEPEKSKKPAVNEPPRSSQKNVRPHPARVSRRASSAHPFTEPDIPLYLVPHIIARAIWPLGERVYRISVVRTKQHYYTIRVRTARNGGKTKKRREDKEAGPDGKR
jgi:hypothetical protein